jgi:flagellar biosynthetic protein FliP
VKLFGWVAMSILGVSPMIAQAPQAPLQQSFWVNPATPHAALKTVSASTKKAASAAKPAAKPAAGTPVKTESKTSSMDPINETLNAINKPGVGGNSTPWAIVFGLTLLTLLPSILLAMTPMVRLLVVFHFLRQALGTQTAPSNQVLMGLALAMTWFLMQPVLQQVDQQALTPYRAGTITAGEAFDRGSVPVKSYMLKYAREKDLAVFVRASGAAQPKTAQDLSLSIIVPSYMLSELKAGFQIGAVLFLPFLMVDFLVASVTTSIGMMQLSPMVISTPVKILLFVIVDGWSLLADQLLKSF